MERFINLVSSAFRFLFTLLVQALRDLFSFTRKTVKSELRKQVKVVSQKRQEVDEIKREKDQISKIKEDLKQHPNSKTVNSSSQVGELEKTAEKLIRQVDRLAEEASHSEIPVLNDVQQLVKEAVDLQKPHIEQLRNTLKLEIKQIGSQITAADQMSQPESIIIQEQPFSFILEEDDMKKSQKIVDIRCSVLKTEHRKIE